MRRGLWVWVSLAVVVPLVFVVAACGSGRLGGALGSADRRFGPLNAVSLRSWYGLTKEQTGAGQVIVLTEVARARQLATSVDAFSRWYGLPKVCDAHRARGNCFVLRMFSPAGMPHYVARDYETELDVEWAHALAPKAQIIVVTPRNRLVQDIRAVGRLARSGQAHVFSTSWCSPCEGDKSLALRRDAQWAHSCALAHVVCLMPSGDGGSPGVTPSNSPHVLAVGGSLFHISKDGALRSQVAWRRSGGGATDAPLPRPDWQQGLPCLGVGKCARVIPDVSGPAGNAQTIYAPSNGNMAVGHSAGGTSLATPIWAALIALANQQLARRGQPPIGINELHRVLYEGKLAAGLQDITTGAMQAGRGWDPRTGLGSPKAGIVDDLVRAITQYRRS